MVSQLGRSGLNKSLQDAAFGQFGQMLGYVAWKLGKHLIKVDPCMLSLVAQEESRVVASAPRSEYVKQNKLLKRLFVKQILR